MKPKHIASTLSAVSAVSGRGRATQVIPRLSESVGDIPCFVGKVGLIYLLLVGLKQQPLRCSNL